MQRGNREWYDRLLSAKSPREQVQLKEGLAVGAGEGELAGGAVRTQCEPASLQPGPQRLAGLVELVDAVYEDLQSCYSIYASLFHRWPQGSPAAPAPSPSSAATGARGEQGSECVLCSIIKIDFFTLTFRQLERLVRQGVGRAFLAGKGPGFPCCWQLDSTFPGR